MCLIASHEYGLVYFCWTTLQQNLLWGIITCHSKCLCICCDSDWRFHDNVLRSNFFPTFSSFVLPKKVSEAYEITFLSVCLITVSALNPASVFTRERTPVPIEQEAGWASDLVWTQEAKGRHLCFCRDQTPAVQSVVRHYNDWIMPAPKRGIAPNHGYFLTERRSGSSFSEGRKLERLSGTIFSWFRYK
jgi:hypothetical protein